ncbi:MAG: S41 family peptidase [Treponema sp.]|nr:S41 family peptidase [Treponema sp.]
MKGMFFLMIMTFLFSSCGKGESDPLIKIRGIEMPTLLEEIVNTNRAKTFGSTVPNFQERALEFLTKDFDHEEDMRIAKSVKELVEKNKIFFGEMDYPSGTPAGTVSRREAIADINFLFSILRYGYTGYGYFGGDAIFHSLRNSIIERLRLMEEPISNNDLLSIISQPLQEVIFDNHFALHTIRFNAPSQVAYMNEDFVIRKTADGYVMDIYAETTKIVATNLDDGTHIDCIVPTITKDGELAFTFGVIADPTTISGRGSAITVSLLLEKIATGEIISHNIILGRIPNPLLFDRRPFEERPPLEQQQIRGITVLENRHMWGTWTDAREMLAAHREFYSVGMDMRDKPAVILDLRWNYGGSNLLGLEWIRGFSGREPAELGLLPFVLSTFTAHELGEAFYPSDDEITFDFLPWSQGVGDTWLSDPNRRGQWFFPELPDWRAIPNETPVIVLTDGNVSSAGETFLSELMQMENVVVVGVNTMGTKLSDGVIRICLPNSGLEIQFGSLTLWLRPDFSQFEGVGYAPDLWVHPRDSLERALAFIERYGIPQ